jgi:amino acid permease
MKKSVLYLILIIGIFLVCIVPFITAYTLQDSIQEQIMNNQAGNANPNINYDSKEILFKMLKENPDVKAAVKKLIIFGVVIAVLAIVEIVLKGIAMWRAVLNKSKIWFWVMLIIQSCGILPLIYLLISKNPNKAEKKEEKAKEEEKKVILKNKKK